MSETLSYLLDFAAAAGSRSALFFLATPASVLLYLSFMLLQKRFQFSLLNPLLLSVTVIVALLALTEADTDDYFDGARPIAMWLDFSIVALAVPLYTRFATIRKQLLPVTLSCLVSVIISFAVTWLTCLLSGADETMLSTVGARSITTPLAMDVAGRLGGIAPVAACIVCCAGISGAVIGFPLMRLFHVRNPEAQGLAIGACAHAIGTAEAGKHGQIQGAYSSVSLVICGIITSCIASPLFLLFQALNSLAAK